MENECDVYTMEGIESYCEDDEISTMEQGFMIGYITAM